MVLRGWNLISASRGGWRVSGLMCGDEEAFFSFLSFPGTSCLRARDGGVDVSCRRPRGLTQSGSAAAAAPVAAPLRCSSVRPSAVASSVLVLRFRGVLLVLAAVGDKYKYNY